VAVTEPSTGLEPINLEAAKAIGLDFAQAYRVTSTHPPPTRFSTGRRLARVPPLAPQIPALRAQVHRAGMPSKKQQFVLPSTSGATVFCE
jgi:hypothetical protein